MTRASDDWYADETLWVETYPFMFPDGSFESAVEQVERLIALTGCRAGALLDLGCGPGRYAVPFAKSGFAVTGVDITPFLMDKARAYAADEGVEIELVAEDMRRFVRPAAFDLAISMLTSFGYFDADEENRAVLGNVFTSLRPGGVFVFDTYGKEVIARIFQATSSNDLPGGGLIVQRREAIKDWTQMENEWLLIKDGRLRTFRLRHWIYSGREFKELLASVGFAKVEVYGDLDGRPYGPDATRLIAIGRKA